MIPDDLEVEIAMQTESGREGLRVWRRLIAAMPGEQKIAKAFELTENTRQLMREGIQAAHPELDDEAIQKLYVDRLLGYHGLSVEKVRRMQREELQRRSRGAET